jgi:hypothetical protein
MYHELLSLSKVNSSIIIRPLASSFPEVSPLALALPPFYSAEASSFDYTYATSNTYKVTERRDLTCCIRIGAECSPSFQELEWIINIIKKIPLDFEMSYLGFLMKCSLENYSLNTNLIYKKENTSLSTTFPSDVLELLSKRPIIPLLHFTNFTERSYIPLLKETETVDDSKNKEKETTKPQSLTKFSPFALQLPPNFSSTTEIIHTTLFQAEKFVLGLINKGVKKIVFCYKILTFIKISCPRIFLRYL